MAGTDYFMKVGRSTATTLSSPGYTIGAASINVGSTTNWPTDTGVMFAIDEVDGNGERVSGTYNVFRGDVASATQINELTYVGGDANRNYSAGSSTRVYILVSSDRDNRLIDGLLESHAQDGTIDAQSVANFQDHIDMVDGKAIRDGNNNEVLKVSQTASAVNEVTVANAATGNAPSLSATGGDTNIDLSLKGKGDGRAVLHGPVAFRATSTQSIATATQTKVTTYTEDFDYGSNFDHTTGDFTAPYNGVYTFSANVAFSDVAASGRVVVWIYVNSVNSATAQVDNNAGNTDTAQSISVTVELEAGQTAHMEAFQTDGATLSMNLPSNFSGHLVARTD